MSTLFSLRTLSVLVAPLRVPEARARIGEALWLYLYLASIASHAGVVCSRLENVSQPLGVDDAQLGVWLTALEKSGLVRVLSPAPFLVIKFAACSGREPVAVETSLDSGHRSGDAHRVPVSSSSAAAASDNYGEDGGQGEGEELLREVLASLDEADSDEFRELITRFPPETVRHALRRVQTTPTAQIRKSKAALFRYLLGKLS